MGNLAIAIIAACGIVWLFGRRGEKRFRTGFSSSLIARPHPDAGAGTSGGDESKIGDVELDLSQINRAFRIGDMHFSRGDFEQAEQWFIKVLSFNSEHPEAMNRLGVIYIQQGNPRRAEILYRNLFSITQKEATYYCNYGRCLYNQGRLDEAIEAYENAVKLDASKSSRFISIGQILYEQKKYVEALERFVRALDIEPQNSDYLRLTAELAELAGDTERLLTSLKKISELEPYNEEVRTRLAKYPAQ